MASLLVFQYSLQKVSLKGGSISSFSFPLELFAIRSHRYYLLWTFSPSVEETS